MERILVDMIKDYQEMNSSHIEEAHYHPTGIEFSRFVQRNRPVVFRGLGFDLQIPAMQQWSEAYIRQKLGDSEIRIAATPKGNADALVDNTFVEPAYLTMSMKAFLDRLHEKSHNEVLYLQSQNDNLHDELKVLLDDATSEVPFATEVFGAKPDVANVWIGDDRSVTSVHKDPYENLYLVVHGTKTFHMLPPTEFYCLHEGMYSTGCYEQDSEGTWSVKQNEARIPWIPIDPSGPVDLRQYPRFKHAQVLDVTLQRGDVLYLPALWFHRVSQTASEDPQAPLAVAINWWYDLAYDSPVWSLANLVRQLTLSLDGREEQV